MTSSPSLYRVSITNPNNASPNDGFIDNCTAELYLANPIGADGINEASLDNLLPSFTLTKSLNKKRGNLRYKAMVQQIELVSNVYIQNVVATGASATSEASTFNFDMVVWAGDGSLMTWDETTANTVISNSIAVIARTISRALIQNITVQADVLDPTVTSTVGTYSSTVSVPRYGVRYESINVGPVYPSLTTANAAITITELITPTT